MLTFEDAYELGANAIIMEMDRIDEQFPEAVQVRVERDYATRTIKFYGTDWA